MKTLFGHPSFLRYTLMALLVVGGVTAFIVFPKGEEPLLQPPPSGASTAVPPHSAAPVLPDIPPPEPLEESHPEQAAPSSEYTFTEEPPKAPPASSGKATKSGSSCRESVCKGQMTPALEHQLAKQAQTARRCYDAALAQDPTLEGQVTIRLRIDEQGRTCSTSIEKNTLSDTSVARCIAGNFRSRAVFPAPQGGCIIANVPIVLKSK